MPQRRVYPLDPRELTEEQLAVVFAMTSRRPEPFDVIKKRVTAEKAADFHERWVLGYGHASVAEHAIIHMAVENVSRLAADELEDNRLASYTEKSSRYQVIVPGDYYVPPELAGHPLREAYVRTCDTLYDAYHQMVERVKAHLATVRPRQEGERDAAYDLRLRREATDSCRFLLPAATLTNIGVTMNARTMEHAIRKLLSSDLKELQELGQELKEQGRTITPTLIKYAERNDYLVLTRQAQEELRRQDEASPQGQVTARLVHWDPQAEEKVVAALLYRVSHQPYEEVWQRVQAMSTEEKDAAVDAALQHLGPFDAPVRELEFTDYTFDLMLDYGAYREYKRHRLQSYVPQPLTVEHGYLVPPLVIQAGLESTFTQAMRMTESGYHSIASTVPKVAAYLVTHAHIQRVLTSVNLRECYHLFKLRTQSQAHFTIRLAMSEALDQIRRVHPTLVKHVWLRD